MKNLLFLLFLVVGNFSFAQSKINTAAFKTLESTIDATIHIRKSDQYGLHLLGDIRLAKQISWDIIDGNLTLSTKEANTDFSKLEIIAYTPGLTKLAVTDGAIATMDTAFSRINNFEVSATNGATIYVSNIEFIHLVAYTNKGGRIDYTEEGYLKINAQIPQKIKSIQ